MHAYVLHTHARPVYAGDGDRSLGESLILNLFPRPNQGRLDKYLESIFRSSRAPTSTLANVLKCLTWMLGLRR